VPASLLCTGTPQQVKDDVKKLIDIVGDNGGLIIYSSVGIPDEDIIDQEDQHELVFGKCPANPEIVDDTFVVILLIDFSMEGLY
jgi:hypothetical protein